MADERTSGARYANRTQVCRSCGALVGAGEAACGVCGAPVGAGAEAARAPRHDAETLRFAHAILRRPATFTFVFLALNVFVFLLMEKFSLPGGTGNFEVLRAYGAKYNSLINQGEWWRLVTPVFIHIGWIHLLVNMYSLFAIGPYVERLYGSAKFVCFWIVTGIAGVGASYLTSSSGVRPAGVLGQFLFRGGDGPSAGASGALFGLVGVLFVFGLKFRRELPDGFKRAFGFGMLPTILVNLFIGYSIPMIDNAAHLGGFAAGCVLALLVGYKRPGPRGSVAVVWHVLQVAALALVAVSFGEVARHMGEARPHFDNAGARLVRSNGLDIDGYISAMNEGQRAFHALRAGEADAAAANRAVEQLDRVRPFEPQADALRGELKQLVVRAGEYAARPDKERRTPQALAEAKRLDKDFADWETRSDSWVKTEGQKYGLRLLEPGEGEQQEQPREGAPPADRQKGQTPAPPDK
ncbi:MAG TPA: rhomboid family intramembrane serine protease [Pyrinomonadaceae bacterium]